MVASSRSSQRRPNLRSNHHDEDADSSSRSSSPVNHDPRAKLPLVQPEIVTHRSKRVRVSSLSDREQFQKRRRLGHRKNAPSVQIPLRGKVSQPIPASSLALTRPPPGGAPPPLLSHDSSISNSPLASPAIGPQYDQFKRIEEKAQRAGQRSLTTHKSQEEKRKLRSEHGGTRAKTELAQYFPSFDEMLSLDPPDPNALVAKSHVILVDDTLDFTSRPIKPDYFGSQVPPHNSTPVDLSRHLSKTNTSQHDPLGPEVYAKAHQKAERHEKQMKNGDKERAQHEKYQLERLLDDLRGPDWLKTLGISGITDTEKKRYEPKRLLFIRETAALINKFKRWKEEEKRRKLEKLATQEDMDGEAEDEREDQVTSSTTRKGTARSAGTRSRNRSHASSRRVSPMEERGPDSSEIDALASQQLLEEAKLANIRRKKVGLPEATAAIIEAPRPFTSFFEKRHMRDAAIGGRQRGRNVFAFGQPLPELDEHDFELPESILTEDAIRAGQRNRRRVRRGTLES